MTLARTVTSALTSDRAFHMIAFVILTVVLIAVFYPLYFLVIASISSPDAIYSGSVTLLPRQVTFEGYERIFADPSIITG